MNTFLFPVDDATAPVRVAGTMERPLFVAADVCEILGLTNPSKALQALDEDEKGLTLSDTLGGQQQLLAITESGVYHLAFKSRKPAAKVFRRWVTDEVLPAIRRTGVYAPEVKAPCGEEQYLTAPQWLRHLKVDLVSHANLVQILMERVNRACQLLKFTPASYREADGFQRIPVAVFNLAIGLYERDLKLPDNRYFFEAHPKLTAVPA